MVLLILEIILIFLVLSFFRSSYFFKLSSDLKLSSCLMFSLSFRLSSVLGHHTFCGCLHFEAVILFEVDCICQVVIIFLGLAIRQDDLTYLLGHAYLSCLSPIELAIRNINKIRRF